MTEIIYLFHHIHHCGGKHEAHHCGGKHKGLNYKIKHCKCGLHSIDMQEAIGHDFNNKPVKVKFNQKCLDGWWHIESGKIKSRLIINNHKKYGSRKS